VRDPETAQIAVQSALTGHLVFTTVHANNVFDVIGRFIHMGVEPYNFVSALNCIVAQRLVRLICAKCKHPVTYPAALIEESGLDSGRYASHVFQEGRGCLECNGTGFKGRMAIAEILDMSDQIRQLILDRRSAAEIKRAAREEGMVFMRDVAVSRALEGHTTLREINKVTFVE
jgi:type IV pilus assembly protein PilB